MSLTLQPRIEIKKKHVYIFISVAILVLTGTYLSTAYGTGDPQDVGHTLGEIEIGEALDMSNYKIINLDSPENSGDAANKGYVDSKISGIGINDRKRVKTTACWYDNNKHTLTSNCPSGYKLLSCSGGYGDLSESSEGWHIRPDLSNERCILEVKKPRCDSGQGWTKQRVYAVCYQ